jgi:hypothetical protein
VRRSTALLVSRSTSLLLKVELELHQYALCLPFEAQIYTLVSNAERQLHCGAVLKVVIGSCLLRLLVTGESILSLFTCGNKVIKCRLCGTLCQHGSALPCRFARLERPKPMCASSPSAQRITVHNKQQQVK